MSGTLRKPTRRLLRPVKRSLVGSACDSVVQRATRFHADFTNGGNYPQVRTTRSGLATQIGPDGTLQWGAA